MTVRLIGDESFLPVSKLALSVLSDCAYDEQASDSIKKILKMILKLPKNVEIVKVYISVRLKSFPARRESPLLKYWYFQFVRTHTNITLTISGALLRPNIPINYSTCT